MAQAPQQRGRSPARRPATGAVRVLTWSAIAIAALAALAAAALLIALPAIEQRPQMVAHWLAGQLGREVRLRALEIAWRDTSPVIVLHDLRIGEAGAGALALAAAETRIDAAASLRAWSLRPAQVTVRGARVQLERQRDGTLRIAGLGENPVTGAGAALALVLDALPGSAGFALVDATVTLIGFGDTALVLSPVSVHVRAQDAGVRLSGALATPQAPDTPLRFTLRWADRGANPLTAAEFTLSTRELPLAALPQPLRPLPLGGSVSLDLDGMVAAGRIELMRGTLALDRLGPQRAPPRVDTLRSLVEFTREDANWRLTLLRVQARMDGELSRPVRVVLRRDASAGRGRYLLSADHVPMAGLLGMLAHLDLPAAMGTRVGEWLRPEGRAEEVELDLGGDLSRARVHRASMTLRDVRAGDPAGTVQVGPADLRLTFMGTAGQIDLLPAPLALRTAAQREPIRLDIGGALRWHLDDGALVADTSALNLTDGDVRLRLEGRVRVPADGAPLQVSGTAAGGGMDAVAMKRYLALDWLPRPLSEWLADSVSAGRLHSLTASLDGAPASDEELARLLRVRARFEQVDLDYLSDWPAITGLGGHLELAQGRLELEVSTGAVSGARIDTARGSIGDVSVDDPVLDLLGRVSGRTEHGAVFLGHTPLAPRFAGLLEQLDAKGRAALDLDLRIGLDSGDTTVRGVIALSDNTVRVPVLRSALSKVSGDIAFDGDGLGTGTLQAVYLDRPISAHMEGTGRQRQHTRLRIEGATDPQGLLRHLYDVGAVDRQDPDALPLLSRLSGRTRWQVLLDIPPRQRIARDGIGLQVRSDLAGMALDLPAPLGKRAPATRPLSIETRLALDGPRTFMLAYGADLHALLQMTPLDGGGHALARGALHFGTRPAQLPEQDGLSVDGEVALLSVDDWIALIAEIAAGAHEPAARGPLSGVRTVNVQAQRLVAMGAGFDDVQLAAGRDAGGTWRVRVRGADVDGEIAIPVPLARAPIEAAFEHLYVRPASAAAAPRRAAGAGLRPQDLPPASLVVKDLRYDDIDLGLARLTLAQREDGLELRDLLALSEHVDLRGTGRWTGTGTDARSALELNIHSNDFGSLTQALGYADSGIRGGVTDIALEAQWDGSPFDFALDRVQGELRFHAAGGRLLEVEPGATGRMFGLLNVTILPRRLLRLDFSDLFQEGVSYERIEGSFRLDEGNAYTEGVRMHTDTARVDLEGRVGLVREDYDQIMTVTPKLSASLPLVPIWLAEKFLNRKLIDNAFAYRYIITGTWQEPKIERERVEVPPIETQ